MGRQASVRQKNGYWFSEAGGVGRYFGRVDVVSRAEAMAKLWAALASHDGDRLVGCRQDNDAHAGDLRTNGHTRPPRRSGADRSLFDRSQETTGSTPTPTTLPTLTVHELADRFLGWLERHRSERTHTERSRHLRRFRDAYGDVSAVTITGSHLEAFTDALRADGHAPEYVRKHSVSVKAMYHRGVKAGWLPPSFQPFAHVEAIRVDRRPLLESDLPTDAEVKALLAHADGFMNDVIRLYHATGARTHELLEALVDDFQPHSRTIVLGCHKRSRTMRDPIPRTITLNSDTHAILERCCRGRDADENIIVNRKALPYTRWEMAHRFNTVRRRAGVRPTISLYSFRHLWISEMLMAGVDVLLVARMAGTSVVMIERVYGHFRNQSYQEAQARLDRERAVRGL